MQNYTQKHIDIETLKSLHLRDVINSI